MSTDAKERLEEEALYEQVAREIEQGIRRNGLWAKAIVEANGSIDLTRSIYIKLRVQSLIDELKLEAIRQAAEKKRLEEQRIDERVKELSRKGARASIPKIPPWLIGCFVVLLVILFARR